MGKGYLRLLTGAASLALMATVAPAASAQDGDNPRENTQDRQEVGDDIIVTANFREQSVNDVAASIRSFSGDDLSERGITTAADLARITPSLNLSDRGPNRNEISIRGVARGVFQQDLITSQPNIGYYLDDVPVNIISGTQLDISPFDLQRVEVLRGPQGTLFGEGAEGGAIRYFTKDPDLTRFGGQAEAYLNMIKDGEVDGGARLALNIPVIEDRLGVRLVGNRTALGGFIDNTADGAKDANGYRAYNLRGVVLAKPTDRLNIRLLGVYEDFWQDALYRVDASPKSRTFGFSSPNDYVSDKYYILSGKIGYDFDTLRLEAITSYYDRVRQREGYEAINGIILALTAGAIGVPSIADPRAATVNNIDRTDWSQFSQELRLVSNFDGPFNFVAGGFYRDFNYKLTQDSRSDAFLSMLPVYNAFYGVPIPANPSTLASELSAQLGFPALFGIPNDSPLLTTGKQYSAFIEGTYKFSDKLEVTAGVRTHNEKISGSIGPSAAATIVNLGPSQAFTPPPNKINELLFKGNISFRPAKNTLLYLNYSEGVRNGNINAAGSLAVIAADPSLGGPQVANSVASYDAERVFAYEAGAKIGLGRRGQLNVAAFYNDIKDFQGFTVVGAVAGVTVNSGDAHAAGFELEFNYDVSDSISVFAGGNYVDAKIDKLKTLPAGVPNDVVKGVPLPNVPEWSLSLGANLDAPIGSSGWSLTGDARFQYTGPFTVTIDDIVGSARNPKFGNFGLVNLGIGVKKRDFYAQLRVSNLLDEKAFVSSLSIDALFAPSFPGVVASGLSFNDNVALLPRTLTLTIGTRF